MVSHGAHKILIGPTLQVGNIMSCDQRHLKVTYVIVTADSPFIRTGRDMWQIWENCTGDGGDSKVS